MQGIIHRAKITILQLFWLYKYQTRQTEWLSKHLNLLILAGAVNGRDIWIKLLTT